MEISIRRFGQQQRGLLGLLQTPPPGKPKRPAFLMCRPFGQEAVRTAPIYRAVSDRLAREGCTVLTFDHHGCGDSPGDLDDESLQGWTDDTLAAHTQLRADAPGSSLHWFAMGLGANIAAGAALRAEFPPACLVLWEPVLNGPAYLDRLKDVHRQELSREMGLEWHQLVARGRETEPELPGSVLGFMVGPRLHADLRQLDELPLAPLLARGVNVKLAVQDEHRARFAQMNDPGFASQSVENSTNWMSTEAFGTAIVPQDVPRTLLATL
jgi:uncharacterized protein